MFYRFYLFFWSRIITFIGEQKAFFELLLVYIMWVLGNLQVALNKNDYLIISPKYIAMFIEEAIEKGWRPLEKSKAFTLEIENSSK